MNALGPRGQARLLGRRASAVFDRAYRSILGKVDSLHGSRWQRGMYYPQRWDPSFGEFMTFEDLLGYPSRHMRRHLSQLSAGDLDLGEICR